MHKTEAAQLIKRFNARFTVGSDCPVRFKNCCGTPFRLLKVTATARVMINEHPMARFEGRWGYIAEGFVNYD